MTPTTVIEIGRGALELTLLISAPLFIAATFASIAGLDRPAYTEAPALPVSDADAGERGFERVLTEWDSVLFGKIVRLRTITRDNWVATACLPGTRDWKATVTGGCSPT